MQICRSRGQGVDWMETSVAELVIVGTRDQPIMRLGMAGKVHAFYVV
jgi:hypothetical protein